MTSSCTQSEFEIKTYKSKLREIFQLTHNYSNESFWGRVALGSLYNVRCSPAL